MKMKTCRDGSPARTWYQVLETDGSFSLIQLQLEHGRTHQIRVHMAAVGHPLAGDPIYGRHSQEENSCTALHAWKLELIHPFNGKKLQIEAPLPDWCGSFSWAERMG